MIITILAGLIHNFADSPIVQNAFAGIRVCVCVLIFNAIGKLWRSAMADRFALLIFCLVFFAALATDFSPVWFILFAALAGVVLKNMGEVKK